MKNANGFGCVFKLSGKRRRPYMARVTSGWNKDNGKQVYRILGYFETYKDGLLALAEYHRNPRKQINVTFEDVYNQLMKSNFVDVGVKIPTRYSSVYNLWCKKLYKMKFVDVKLAILQDAINSCQAGACVKKNMKILFNKMFKYAIGQDIVDKNYAELVKLPAIEDSTIHKHFTPKEMNKLWSLSDNYNVQAILILCYTGMRPGEYVKIKKSDIHLDEKYMIGGIKTKAGKNRTIPIADCIEPFILQRMNKEGEFLEVKLEDNSQMNYDYFVKHIWNEGINTCGLDGHLPHDGRHTCSTYLYECEVQPIVVDKIIGHASKSLTEKVYVHLTNIESLIEAVNKIPTKFDESKTVLPVRR